MKFVRKWWDLGLLFYRQVVNIISTIVFTVACMVGDKAFTKIFEFGVLDYTIKVYWLLDIIGALAVLKLYLDSTFVKDHKENQHYKLITSALENKIEYQVSQYKVHMESYLQLIANDFLKLKSCERITIYRPHSSNYTKLARYSRDPALKSPGRPHYPKNEGFISLALRNDDRFFVRQHLCDPSVDVGAYHREVSQLAPIPVDTIKSMSMKSRAYAVFALEEPQYGNTVAIVVIESTKRKFSDLNLIKSEMTGNSKKQIIHYIKGNSYFEPDISFAQGKGF